MKTKIESFIKTNVGYDITFGITDEKDVTFLHSASIGFERTTGMTDEQITSLVYSEIEDSILYRMKLEQDAIIKTHPELELTGKDFTIIPPVATNMIIKGDAYVYSQTGITDKTYTVELFDQYNKPFTGIGVITTSTLPVGVAFVEGKLSVDYAKLTTPTSEITLTAKYEKLQTTMKVIVNKVVIPDIAPIETSIATLNTKVTTLETNQADMQKAMDDIALGGK